MCVFLAWEYKKTRQHTFMTLGVRIMHKNNHKVRAQIMYCPYTYLEASNRKNNSTTTSHMTVGTENILVMKDLDLEKICVTCKTGNNDVLISEWKHIWTFHCVRSNRIRRTPDNIAVDTAISGSNIESEFAE